MPIRSLQHGSIDRRNSRCRRLPTFVVSRPRCAGFTLTELIVATVLLGTLITAAVPTLRWVGHEQHAIDHRQVAMLEAENLMDRIVSQAWDQMTPDFATTLKISDEAQRQLPESKLEVSVTPSTDANAKRVSLSLSWQERKKLPVAPVRLTTWVYRRGRSE